MTVLITGSTGYVGSWTTKALQDRGRKTRLIVRDADKARAMGEAVGFTTDDLVIGDLRDRELVAQALQGCDAVVHTAAAVVVGGDDSVIEQNLQTTKNVVGQAVDAGIASIIHVGSTSAIWTPGDSVITADRVAQRAIDTYAASKIAAETYVRGLQDAGAPISITYPSSIIGPPAGHHLGESGDGLGAMIEIGIIPGTNTGMNFIDVRDLAEAHVKLLEATPGRRYVVSSEYAGASAIAALINQHTCAKVKHIKVPGGAMITVGRFADRFRRFMPELMKDMTEGNMVHLTLPPAADGTPITRDLGLTYRPLAETIAAVSVELRARHCS